MCPAASEPEDELKAVLIFPDGWEEESSYEGGLVPGAHVVIACADPPASRETDADAEGFFNVGGLPAGTYSVTISSTGLETYVVSFQNLDFGQGYALSLLVTIATAAASLVIMRLVYRRVEF